MKLRKILDDVLPVVKNEDIVKVMRYICKNGYYEAVNKRCHTGQYDGFSQIRHEYFIIVPQDDKWLKLIQDLPSIREEYADLLEFKYATTEGWKY